eukprot:CAMPEP_0181227522 /NCGR_PEP_ID=MMETSP1096-20121128/32834_1 /TAXON_ID=156174 ORGANISM="Chrysochromulina ericina, Strain CCMP281" /NCGR_SAMPLE_ID=MMETSP1096 /ASSEMBLY_ACC=CAM_ASM_000453 /LENGTH=114 /DNA_ID=CAMNT_0023320935 /DNA_START=254 /DNA_END=600 /DNA_ORIENTATION=-
MLRLEVSALRSSPGYTMLTTSASKKESPSRARMWSVPTARGLGAASVCKAKLNEIGEASLGSADLVARAARACRVARALIAHPLAIAVALAAVSAAGATDDAWHMMGHPVDGLR